MANEFTSEFTSEFGSEPPSPEPPSPVWLRQFRHLLPQCRAWNIDIPEKNLTKFFNGLTGLGNDSREFFDSVFSDIRPATTRSVTEWEEQFGLRDSAGLTEADRRQRLAAAWTAWGGQSVEYLQTILQSFGFDVYLHEWWVPGSSTPRNPLDYLDENDPSKGYPLVTKTIRTGLNYLTGCGETIMEAGNDGAECGNFDGFVDVRRKYTIPNDPTVWPYFLYVGAETFPNKADVLSTRREEFEALLLKYLPARNWIGVLVNYI